MRFLLLIGFVLFASICSAQLSLKPLKRISSPRSSVPNARDENGGRLQLPFWDDFSTSDGRPDTNRWEFGEHVWVNNTQGVNAPTFNVATFDGANAEGRPYSATSTFSGAADSLVSCPIDLSRIPIAQRSTVYFSFFWQIRGNGEIPEESDSLRVQFLRNDTVWVSQDLFPNKQDTSVIMGGSDRLVFDPIDGTLRFSQVIIPVGSAFFHENFRIKFQAFNSLNGVFDTWNIDYVYLDVDRAPDDVFYFDRSLSRTPSPLFGKFYEMPMSQFQVNPGKYLSPQTFQVSNLDNQTHPMDAFYELFAESSLYATSDAKIFEVGFTDYILLAPTDFGPFQSLGDSVGIEASFFLRTSDTTFLDGMVLANDTFRTTYALHNHYAYDDGSAEFAAGINLNRGQVAVRYILEEPDTLTEVLMNFPNLEPSSAGESITVKIWKDLEEDIVLKQQPYIIPSISRDQFDTVNIGTPLILRDTFYVGYQQFTDDYIGIGFDKNNEVAFDEIFTNTNRVWEQNQRLVGSLMIRPVFRSSVDFVLGKNPENSTEIGIYPNPTNGLFHVLGDIDRLEILDISGKRVSQYSPQKTYDLRGRKPGIYILQMHQDQRIFIRKIILK
ncbi:MAG: T9SS type A sorting domain-containing protein [Cyclobacteriaceae bacterium]|nr:T9SS type A sorting domain-containing protein [Cyclobacteriaceae bacterium HetDA_MAG_MS6]